MVFLISGPTLLAGWGECDTFIVLLEQFAKLTSISRCTYERFGVQDNSVRLTATHTIDPGDEGDVAFGYGYVGTTFDVSPYEASTTYTSTAVFRASQLLEFDSKTVTGSLRTPDPRRPHSIDDSLPCPCPYESPIILALGPDDYTLTSVTAGVRFDLRNEGRLRRTSWTAAGSDNAFLALDRNGNGKVDNGSELFGAATVLRSGFLAPNGFVALAEFDENRDQTIDASDAVWPLLLFWTDLDHDGRSSNGELQRVAESVVVSLDTTYQTIGKKDQWGNLLRYMARVQVQSNGHTRDRKYYDVLLQIEP